MPRRRRKSSFQSKPSLIFTESPVNIVKNVPSPVMCARFPPTATSIPIEELDELTWVSPQFTRVPNTVRAFGKRVQTRRRKSLTTSTINKENTLHTTLHANLNNKPNKFKSLKFIGEKTVEESVAEEVNISFDSVSTSEVESGNDARISDQDSPGNEITTGIIINKRNRLRSRANDLTNHQSSTNHSTPVESSLLNKRPCHDVEDECVNHDESSELDLTRLKPRTLMKSPVKRLFASQINLSNVEISDSENDENIVSTIQTEVDTESDKAPSNEEIDKITETDTSMNSESDFDKVIPNSDSDLDTSLNSNPGVRRSKRLRLLRQILDNGISPNKDAKAAVKVLAPDTPVDKHGWTLKKYQINQYLLNKR